MMHHDTGTRQCSGWWPALVEAHCSCGWVGPTRDANTYAWPHIFKADLDRDQAQHLREAYA